MTFFTPRNFCKRSLLYYPNFSECKNSSPPLHKSLAYRSHRWHLPARGNTHSTMEVINECLSEGIVEKSSLDSQGLCSKPPFYLLHYAVIREKLRELRKDHKFNIPEENNVKRFDSPTKVLGLASDPDTDNIFFLR
ncbi:hypothetical protein NPIL_553801 [Nephila pilipes]|uniref:Uncharacterized protein n=1 Tax=Nephila pilipes TaxID=299642 RepID=A0A8X6UED0_NEPPI|nr:hypothetical protein NPIL_553801 [Nephila pilipes]